MVYRRELSEFLELQKEQTGGAATVIAAAVRGWRGRRLARWLAKARQAALDAHVARVESAAATSVQAVVRGRQGRRERLGLLELREMEELASLEARKPTSPSGKALCENGI